MLIGQFSFLSSLQKKKVVPQQRAKNRDDKAERPRKKDFSNQAVVYLYCVWKGGV